MKYKKQMEESSRSPANLQHTRAIIDAIHSDALHDADTTTDPVFGLEVPKACPGVPTEILIPKNTWSDAAAFDAAADKLASLFAENFASYQDVASDEIKAAAPRQTAASG